MHLVILAYHYPPDSAVGALRPARIARAFSAEGHRVTVITATLAGESPGIRSTSDGITVEAVRPMRNPREWYAAWKRRGQTAPAGSTSAATADGRYVKPVATPFWKRFIFSMLWLPDDRQGFILPAVRAARPLLREPGAVLYTTAPPFSTLVAGWRLKRRTGARWVAEFRDPWAGNPWKPWHVRTAASDRVELWLERRVLENADLVVAVSDGIERLLAPRVPSERLVTVRNGIDRLAPPRTRRAPGPLKLVHVGSFYHGRDPMPFLEGLAAIVRERNLSDRDIRVDLVGQCRWFQGKSVEASVRDLELQSIVHFHDWVPHEQARAFIDDADILVLLAQDQPDQVPNKLYEYLGSRQSILAFVDERGESADLLRKVGGHSIITETGSWHAAPALAELIDRAGVPPAGNDTVLRELTSEGQMRRLFDSLSKG